MEFYLYNGRHGEVLLVPKSRAGWDFLVDQMAQDNNMTFEEAEREGFEIEGSYEAGWTSMDDGGSINTISLTELGS